MVRKLEYIYKENPDMPVNRCCAVSIFTSPTTVEYMECDRIVDLLNGFSDLYWDDLMIRHRYPSQAIFRRIEKLEKLSLEEQALYEKKKALEMQAMEDMLTPAEPEGYG